MPTYTVRVANVCAGGEHITLNVRRDGTVVKKLTVTKTDILQNQTEFEEALLFFLRAAIKKAGATTTAQAKTAIESAEWVI